MMQRTNISLLNFWFPFLYRLIRYISQWFNILQEHHFVLDIHFFVTEDIFHNEIGWKILVAELSNTLVLEKFFETFHGATLRFKNFDFDELFSLYKFGMFDHPKHRKSYDPKIKSKMISIVGMSFNNFFSFLPGLFGENYLRLIAFILFHLITLLLVLIMIF